MGHQLAAIVHEIEAQEVMNPRVLRTRLILRTGVDLTRAAQLEDDPEVVARVRSELQRLLEGERAERSRATG